MSIDKQKNGQSLYKLMQNKIELVNIIAILGHEIIKNIKMIEYFQ